MFSYDGKHHSVTGLAGAAQARAVTRCRSSSAAWGRSGRPRLAARYAAEFNLTFAQPDAIAPGTERVRQACEAIDRDPATMTFSIAQVACVGTDDAEFERRAAAIGHDPEHLRANGVGGTLDQARDRLAVYADQGIERVYLQVLDLDDLDHVRMLAELL